MDPVFAQSILEKIRADYEAIATSFAETRERSYDVKPLTADVKSRDRVLDVGCGNGRLLDVLPIGVQYTGCDTSARMIEIARKRQTVQLPTTRFTLGDVLSLPFEPASFDHVFALAVLHHIPSEALRQQTVRELARVVKPGGRVTITVWNLWSWYWTRRYKLWRLFFGIHRKGYDRGDCFIPWKHGVEQPIMRYVHAWTHRALRTVLTHAGLRIVRVTHDRNITIVAEKG